MYAKEIVNPEGLRIDGRRATELRRMNCGIGIFSQADGSAFVEHGNTKCLATVHGPREPQRRMQTQLNASATVNVTFTMASFSAGERKQKVRQDRRLLEIASMVKSTFEGVIMVAAFPKSEININLQILQTDGGILHAAINAATLAIIDAGIAMNDFVSACSAAYANETSLLDINYTEEISDIPIVTIACLSKSKKIVLVSSETRLHLDNFAEVLNLATAGCAQIADILDDTVRKEGQKRAKIGGVAVDYE
ncbi:Exosome complex component RRP41 [Irineochytrium annulatum]|nr:Exosome complex component RRP41 [Irineochytrium annulatum]